jgi:hypothetical protein
MTPQLWTYEQVAQSHLPDVNLYPNNQVTVLVPRRSDVYIEFEYSKEFIGGQPVRWMLVNTK